MSVREEEEALDAAEAHLGAALGRAAENQRLRIGIHRAIDLADAGNSERGLAVLRELVGRAPPAPRSCASCSTEVPDACVDCHGFSRWRPRA